MSYGMGLPARLRHATFAILLLACVLCAPAAESADEEWERPWDGFLPSPAQASSNERGLKAGAWFGVRVTSARTGLPVRGARLLRTPEWIAPYRRRHDVILSSCVTDADGLAWVRQDADVWDGESHWLVVAPGHSQSYEYGTRPDWDVRLEPAGRIAGRLVDPLGRPVEGGLVEHLAGCSHGTATASATTDADGLFALENVMPGSGQLWFGGRSVAWDLMAASWLGSMGTRPALILGEVGGTYQGQVVDLAGKPVEDVVVRSMNEQRGPTAVTGPDGRFVIDGVDDDGLLVFYGPADLVKERVNRFVDDGVPGVPMTVTLAPTGVVAAEATSRVRVRTVDATGGAVGSVWFRLVAVATGRGYEDETAGEAPQSADEPPLGSTVVAVAPGTHRLIPAAPFGPQTFRPVQVTVAAGAEATVEVVVQSQPRLHIEGEIPESATVTLAIPGAELGCVEPVAGWRPALPSTQEAALRVELEEAPPFFFRVGSVSAWVRTVVVNLPKPCRIVLPAGASPTGASLEWGRHVVPHREGKDGALETWAEGPVRLLFEDADGHARQADIVLPEAPGGTVTVALAATRLEPATVSVRLIEREGEASVPTQEVEPGSWVTFERPGFQPVRCVAPRTGVKTVRRGTCSLSLRILDEFGDPVSATVLLSGELHAAPAGQLVVRGLDPGAHRLLVAHDDAVGGGREVRVVLAKDDSRKKTIRLGARP